MQLLSCRAGHAAVFQPLARFLSQFSMPPHNPTLRVASSASGSRLQVRLGCGGLLLDGWEHDAGRNMHERCGRVPYSTAPYTDCDRFGTGAGHKSL